MGTAVGPCQCLLGNGQPRNGVVSRVGMTLLVPSSSATSWLACKGTRHSLIRCRSLCLHSALGGGTRAVHPNSQEFVRLLQISGRRQPGPPVYGCRCVHCRQWQGAAVVVVFQGALWPGAESSKGQNAVVAPRSGDRGGLLEVFNAVARAIRTQTLAHCRDFAERIRSFPSAFVDHKSWGHGLGTGGAAGGSGDGTGGGGGNGSGDGGGEFSRGNGLHSYSMESGREKKNTSEDVGAGPRDVAPMVRAGELEARTKYHCSSVEVVNPQGYILNVSAWPSELIEVRPGASCSREDIEASVSQMLSTGWYDNVKGFFVKQSDKEIKVVFQIQGFEHPPVSSCRFVNAGPVFDGYSWHPLGSVPKSADGLETESAQNSTISRLGSSTLENTVEDGAPRWRPTQHQNLQSQQSSSFSPRAFSEGFLPYSGSEGPQDIVRSDVDSHASIVPGPRSKMRTCLLPLTVQTEIADWLKQQGNVTVQTLSSIQKWVEKWYRSNGYNFAKVKSFDGVVDGALQFNVVEGDITRLRIFHEDKGGRHTQGHTRDSVIRRELPTVVREGMQYNVGAGKAALHSIFQLRLFDKVQVTPQPDTELADDGGVMLDVVVSERPAKCAYVDTEWSFVTTDSGRPDLSTLQPGGSLFVEHRNIAGLNRSVSASIGTTNVLQPQDDLRFKLEYLHPYLDGHSSSLNRSLRASCFNKRKLSALFAGGRQPPAIWVDRAGIKLNVTENFTKRSKLTYGLVVEEVATRDEASVIRNNGLQPYGDSRTQAGRVVDMGGSGVDHLVFLQCKVTRDNTVYLNGMQVGARDVFQVDQSIGIGSMAPVFNRHNLGMTRFMALGKVPVQSDHPPRVLVIHGRYGGCVGDVPRYHAFTSGGPYALRAQNVGELTSSRHFLELAAEVRVPVQKSQVYAYAEMGGDLSHIGDGRSLCSRVRRGSYGAGVSLGLVRAEYVVDSGSDSGCFKVCFGERW